MAVAVRWVLDRLAKVDVLNGGRKMDDRPERYSINVGTTTHLTHRLILSEYVNY